MANDAGGVDNITLCVARIEEQEMTKDVDEARRLTVEWGEGPEMEVIREIIVEQFPHTADERSEHDEDTGPITVQQKKKPKGGFWVITLFLIIAAAAVLVAFLK
jgi:hypothetical protein